MDRTHPHSRSIDSIMATVPVSSPLHPQAALPLLKGYLRGKGFNTKVIDTNIKFYHWFLGEKPFDLTAEDLYEQPLSILSQYNKIESLLWDKSQEWDELAVGLRYLSMKYNRTKFTELLAALDDRKANPFIEFYEELVEEEYVGTTAKIAGISITFQDQLIPAFTLAKVLREKVPDIKIVLGGQIITRCYETMLADGADLAKYYDFLVLWDGEQPIHDLHEIIINGEDIDLINVIDAKSTSHEIHRKSKAPKSQEIPPADYADIDFDQYYFPEMLVPFQTTRGCYASCGFCAIPYGSNSYRIRTTSDIIDDLVAIQDYTETRFGKRATFFKFMEDTSSPTLLYKMSCEIEKRGLDIKWETFARLEKAFTRPGMMEQLYRGGCRKIHWGLESNDPGILSNMKKGLTHSFTNDVLKLSADAGILNFCFVLVGFPGESDHARKRMAEYIIDNKDIHTITLTTFDLTRGAPMQIHFKKDNPYKIDRVPPEGFQVRLAYTVAGENWKAKIISYAHEMMLEIVKHRPDIGFVTLFPDQIRAMFCDRFGNDWGRILVERYGEEKIKDMLTNTQKYMDMYQSTDDLDATAIPEPLRREHYRTKEDLKMISEAVGARRLYENRRFDQV